MKPKQIEKRPFSVGMTFGNAPLLEWSLYLDLRMMEACSTAPRGYLPVAKVPMHLDHGIPFLEMVSDGRRVQAIFDTGAGCSVLNARLTDLEGREVLSHEVFDPTGASRMLKLYRGPSLSLGRHELGTYECLVTDLRQQETLPGSPIDFILGVNTMLRPGGILELDGKAGQFGWG